MKLKYFKMNEDVTTPKFATEGSACFDICAYIKEDMEISVYDMSNRKHKRKPEWYNKEHGPKLGPLVIRLSPAERVLVPTGIIFNIPENHSVRLHTRSSISLKLGLTMPNGEGIIDSDYYHQTFVMLHNASADEVIIKHGDKIAQAELIPNLDYCIEETIDVPEQKTTRVGGFGSTGK
jgi:dUTP pyrophosphatase